MIKILHILYSGLGGTSDVCQILGKIDKKIISKTNFLLVGPKKLKLGNVNFKNREKYVKTYKFLTILYFLPVLKKIISLKPDIIFIHNYQIIPAILYKYLKSVNVKIIYVDHTPYTLKKYKDFIISKFFKNFIDIFIVLNNDSYQYFVNDININPKKVRIIPNAINKYFFTKTAGSKNKNSLIIGMAARINKLKHHDLIIDAIQSKTLSKYKIICYFAGNGENLDYLKDKIFLKKKFKFFGNLNQHRLKKWFYQLDLYIQATKGEGHSTSILQAMGMNLPVLASNVSGIKKFLKPDRNIGILFENNSNSLAIKIKYFIEMNRKKKNKIILSQKKYLIQNYAEEIVLKKYISVISSLIF